MFKFWPFWTLTISFHSRYPEIWRIILQCSYERQRSGSICQSLHSIFPEFWCLHRDTKLNFDLGSAFGNCNIQTEHGINMTEWVMGRIWCVKLDNKKNLDGRRKYQRTTLFKKPFSRNILQTRSGIFVFHKTDLKCISKKVIIKQNMKICNLSINVQFGLS